MSERPLEPGQRMAAAAPPPQKLWQHLHEWWLLWWNNLYVGSAALLLMASPASYSLRLWNTVAQRVYVRLKWPLVLFLLLVALASSVLTRIVAQSLAGYGLAGLTMPLVQRVLVLELLPLAAALVVAIKMGIPMGAELAGLRRARHLQRVRQAGGDPLRSELLPRLLMSLYASTMFTAFGSVLAMGTLYVGVYGYTAAGLSLFTHEFGRIMTVPFSIIYFLKVLSFGFVVGLIPLTSGIYNTRYGLRSDTELATLARMLAILLLIEVLCLALHYF